MKDKHKRLLENWRRWPDLVRAYLSRKIRPPVRYTSINYETPLRTWMEYHQKNVAFNVRWMGVQTLKNVTDIWIYQELLWKVKPDVVLEIGGYRGGSTLYLAQLMDLIGHGEVISLDISRDVWEVEHPRITLVTGDSTDPQIIGQVTQLVAGRSTLIIHDGDHQAATVIQDLRAYSPLVTVGSYLIVEDGLFDVIKSETEIRPFLGPLNAVTQFLAENPYFEVDHSCERYMITQNPGGYLKRVS